jgi:putative FmdB family regulatory protein
MPIYEYRCGSCGFQKDHLQKMSDPVLTVCPECNAESYTKQLSAAGFQLKGSGWYATDFKGGSQQQAGSRQLTAPPPARPAPEDVRAWAADSPLLRHRIIDLGPPGDYRLGAVAYRRHDGSVAAAAAIGVSPQEFARRRCPGMGVILTLLIIFVTGILAANFIGQRLVVWWERLLTKIPVVNSIYNSVKQVSDTLFSSSGNAFRKALLVQYPREGSWTIAFLTGQPGGDVTNHLQGDYVSVYVPTTPNPTSGFFLMMPKKM